jgi:hypothetical protein
MLFGSTWTDPGPPLRFVWGKMNKEETRKLGITKEPWSMQIKILIGFVLFSIATMAFVSYLNDKDDLAVAAKTAGQKNIGQNVPTKPVDWHERDCTTNSDDWVAATMIVKGTLAKSGASDVKLDIVALDDYGPHGSWTRFRILDRAEGSSFQETVYLEPRPQGCSITKVTDDGPIKYAE